MIEHKLSQPRRHTMKIILTIKKRKKNWWWEEQTLFII